MTPSPRGQAGFTYIEVLIAMTLMLVITGASMAVFEAANRGTRDNQRLNEAQRDARVATDSLALRLRNLASPSDASGATSQQPVERALAQDLIFRTISSEGTPSAGNAQNLERYRYCLDGTGQLRSQRQTWTGADPGVPAGTACPAAGWSQTRIVAQHVTNGTRPVFHYELNPTEGAYSDQTSVAASAFSSMIGVRTSLWIDPDPARAPRETALTTRVYLRNQNRPPVARFTVSPTTGPATVQLNGSASEDPEGNQLSYEWLDNGVLKYPLDGKSNPSALYTVKLAAGSHSLQLRVRDVGDLTNVAVAKVVTCATTGGTTSCTVPAS
jgi:type II secretory pathway pseudopilin PulG